MFDPKIKVYKPNEHNHNLSFTSKLTLNFGRAKVALCKHFFAGEEVPKLTKEHLLKLQPLLAPVFEKYDVRFDSFVIPEDVHWKDVLDFYKIGNAAKKLPSPSIAPYQLYMMCLIDVFFNRGISSNVLNPWNDTLIDDFNLPTFSERLDEIRKWASSDSAVLTFLNTYLLPEDYPQIEASLDIPFELVTDADILSLPFYIPWAPVNFGKHSIRTMVIRGLFIEYVFGHVQFINVLGAKRLVVVDGWNDNSWYVKMHTVAKDVNLIPFLSYQSLWREYYRNGWVDENENSFYVGNSPYLPDDVDVYELMSLCSVDNHSIPTGIKNPLLVEVDDPDSNPINLIPSVFGWHKWGYYNESENLCTPWLAHLIAFHTNSAVPDEVYEAATICRNIVGVFDVNYVNDYFTSASITSQGSAAVKIPITSQVFVKAAVNSTIGSDYVNSDGVPVASVSGKPWDIINNGTIPDLRLANVMQMIEEKSAMASGNRKYEFYKLFFGHIISDSRLHRPEFIGRQKNYVSISEVTQTGMSEEGKPLGDYAGKGSSVDSSFLAKVKFDEPSWLMVIVSVLPRQSYFQGFPVEMVKTDPYDFLIPDLQHTGMRSIDSSELFVSDGDDAVDGAFGFTDMYNEYRCSLDEIHGEFRDSMSYWLSNRRFVQTPRLNPDFIRCNSNDEELYKPFAVTDGFTSHIVMIIHWNIESIRPLDLYPSYSL